MIDLDTLTRTVDAYCGCWTDGPADELETRLEGLVTQDVRYADPSADVSGLGALAEHIVSTLGPRPGARILRTTEIDLHHDLARFGWKMQLADGTTPVEGVDIVRIEPASGRLASIFGFFGPTKPLAAV